MKLESYNSRLTNPIAGRWIQMRLSQAKANQGQIETYKPINIDFYNSLIT